MTHFAFSTDLLIDSIVRADEYLMWEVTADQFRAIQHLCSGSTMEPEHKAAYQWAIARSQMLDQEATGNAESPDFPYGYCLTMPYCNYHACDRAVIYETTSGTRLLVFADNSLPGVMLPKSREKGYHHSQILLVLGGLSLETIDRLNNTHRVTHSGTDEECRKIYEERSSLYDAVLCPHGFEKQESADSLMREKTERRASLEAKLREEAVDFEHFKDFEDFDGEYDSSDFDE